MKIKVLAGLLGVFGLGMLPAMAGHSKPVPFPKPMQIVPDAEAVPPIPPGETPPCTPTPTPTPGA